MKLLSIIIPLYNAERYLRQCVDSCYQQNLTEDQFEIIIINDGSSDASFALAQEIATEHSNIVVKDKANGGAASARNVGLSLASGQYVAFLDSDDYYLPVKFGEAVLRTVKDELDIGRIDMFVSRKGQTVESTCSQPFGGEVKTGKEYILAGIAIGSVCSDIYSLSFLRKNKLTFQEGVTREDVIFNTYAYPLAQRMEYLGIKAYYYRWNESSIDRSQDVDRLCKNLISDLNVAQQTNKAATLVGGEVGTFYKRRSNSLVVGFLNRLLHDKRIDRQHVTELFNKACAIGLVPIKGRTLNWRSTLIIPFLNCKWLYK
jgi:glycosyltransferase involved in cell wall biosynthesis